MPPSQAFIRVTLGLLIVAPPAFPQGAGAAVVGTITDAQQAVLPGVTLSLRNAETGVTRTTVSEADGRYRFPALPPGRYELKAQLAGFTTVEVSDIVLTIGLELRRDITMNIRSVEEAVTVTAETPLVDSTKSDVAAVVTGQQIALLPVNTRQFLNLALLMPGTSQDASRPYYNNIAIGAGGTFYSNGFVVDGVTNTWAEQGEPRQNIPSGAVQEFRVNTMQFKA